MEQVIQFETNAWLSKHRPRIVSLITNCETDRLAGTYEGHMDLIDLLSLVRGAVAEIERQNQEIFELKSRLVNISEGAKKELEKVQQVIGGQPIEDPSEKKQEILTEGDDQPPPKSSETS